MNINQCVPHVCVNRIVTQAITCTTALISPRTLLAALSRGKPSTATPLLCPSALPWGGCLAAVVKCVTPPGSRGSARVPVVLRSDVSWVTGGRPVVDRPIQASSVQSDIWPGSLLAMRVGLGLVLVSVLVWMWVLVLVLVHVGRGGWAPEAPPGRRRRPGGAEGASGAPKAPRRRRRRLPGRCSSCLLRVGCCGPVYAPASAGSVPPLSTSVLLGG